MVEGNILFCYMLTDAWCVQLAKVAVFKNGKVQYKDGKRKVSCCELDEPSLKQIEDTGGFTIGLCSASKRFKVITRLANALFAVFNGGSRAIADAGHAVGAFTAPNRLAALQRDVIGRAALYTLPAACAGIADSESLCLYNAGIKNRIYRPAHKAVIQIASRRGKALIFLYGGNGARNIWLCPGHDLPRFIRLRGAEQGNIVFRHNDLCSAHGIDALGPTKLSIVFVGIADLTAAGHYKPCSFGAMQRCVQQVILHKPGYAPCIGGRNDHKPLAGIQRRGIARLYAAV